MSSPETAELESRLRAATERERRAYKRATLYTVIPVLCGLLFLGFSFYQFKRLERSKAALATEADALRGSVETLKAEEGALKQRVGEYRQLLAEAERSLERIQEKQGDPVQEAEKTLTAIRAAGGGGRWVVISGDRNLPEAQYEEQLAGKKYGAENVAIYLRQNSYRTVIAFRDEAEARAKLSEVRSFDPRNRRWQDAYLRDLSAWCPNPQPRGGYFECSQ